MNITGQEKKSSLNEAEVLAYVRQQTADGFDLMITNAEAKLLLERLDRVSGGAKMFAGMAGRNLSRAFEHESLLREALTVCSDGNASGLARRIEEALARAEQP